MAPDPGERAALNEIVSAAGALLDPRTLAELTVGHVCDLAGADASELYWWDEAERVLTPLATSDPGRRPPDPQIHPGQGMIGVAFVDNAERAVADYRTDVPGALAYARRRSVACVPLAVDGRPRGVLTAVRLEVRPFGEDDLRLLRTIARQITPALVTMRLLAQAQRREAEARALADLLLSGAAAADADEVFALIARYACRLLGADVAGVSLADPDGRASSWAGVYGARTELWKQLTYAPGSFVSDTLFRSDGPIVTRRGDPQAPIRPETLPFMHAECAQVALSVPLRHESRTVGALQAGWRFAHTIADRHVEFATALAGFAAVLADQSRESHLLRAIVGGAPIVVGATDANGTITMVDGHGLEGLSVGPDAVGRPAREVFADAPELLEALAAQRPGMPPRTVVVRFQDRAFETHLAARAGGGVLVATDVTDRQTAEDALRHQATHDVLTGLPNLVEVTSRTTDALTREAVSVVRVDLRAFDDVNETVGHVAADAALVAVGRRLAAGLPDALVVGRVGGDEFALVVPARVAQPAIVADEVDALLAEPVLVEDSEVLVDGRCGLATGAIGDDGATVLRQADGALQRARREDRRVVAWDATFAAERQTTLRLTADLRDAVAAGHLELAFQPVVDLDSGRIVRAEALLRWNHSRHGAIGPQKFIPLAERSGLIGAITAWVLDAALAQCRSWRDTGLDLTVAVNVSAIDLDRKTLPSLVLRALERHGLDPGALVVEVTETAFADTARQARETAQALRSLGVRLSLDDFGIGWSSLSYLRRLPVAELKIDRSFVATMRTDPRDQAIVTTILGLTRALGTEVVAEGIEDARTASMLAELGCRAGQGFALGRPGPADEITARGRRDGRR